MNGTVLLKAWRIKHNVSQIEAAKLFGTSQQNLQRWEDGTVPNINYAITIETKTEGEVPVKAWKRKAKR